MNITKLKYTLKHKKAFLMVEKQLLGRNTWRGILHDGDKLILYCFLPYKYVHKIHRKFSRHHELRAHTESDFTQMVIDWECARFTKPDKPLNAYDTLYRFYPELAAKVLPIIKKLGLIE